MGKHDASYYFKCVIGGALACGLTHCAVTPLDLVKCRRQVNPDMYPSLVSGLRTVGAADGWGTRGLFTGGIPTLIGYSIQGCCKFGFYEMFKDVYANIAGDNADRFKVIGWSMSMGSCKGQNANLKGRNIPSRIRRSYEHY